MKKCPRCEKYTLEFDTYFGRFRCFNADCHWMAVSTTEMALNRLGSAKATIPLVSQRIDPPGFDLTSYYDPVNDAIVVDFGREEPSSDLPEPDGYMIWKVGHHSESVTGFVLTGVNELKIREIQVDLDARKETIESSIKRLPEVFRSGRPTRVLIDRIEVTATMDESPEKACSKNRIGAALDETLSRFREKCLADK